MNGATPDDGRGQSVDALVSFLERWLTWREQFIYTECLDILKIECWVNGEAIS